MATKKSTTKAKTKTTNSKTPAQKTVAAKAKTSASKTKTTAKKPAVKPAKVVSAKQTKTSRFATAGTTLFSLRRLHIFSIVVFAALAVAAWMLMGNTSSELTVGYLAKDELATGTVLAPAVHTLYDVEIRWIVVGISLLSAVLPLLYVTKFERRYGEALKNTRMVPWRWIDFGITMGLILETVALLGGVHDLFVLKLVGGLMVVTCLLGLIAERQNNTAAKPVWSAFYVSLVSGILPWIVIAAYAVSTVVYGSVWSPWYVYALYAATVIGFSLIGLNKKKQLKGTGKWQNYFFVERNYAVLGLLTKAAFAVILIVGLR
jgi:hypothetical protein